MKNLKLLFIGFVCLFNTYSFSVNKIIHLLKSTSNGMSMYKKIVKHDGIVFRSIKAEYRSNPLYPYQDYSAYYGCSKEADSLQAMRIYRDLESEYKSLNLPEENCTEQGLFPINWQVKTYQEK